MNIIKKNYRYLFVFLFLLFVYFFFGHVILFGDSLANYGFSYAIVKGQIPYLDFNMISTPLFAFLGAFSLLFGNQYFVFLIMQALLVTFTFYFLYQLFGKKSYLILFSMVIIRFFGILPTYNYCCFFFLVLLLFLEKKYPNHDFLIGIIIGLAVLSKQTVGLFFVLPSILFYFKNLKRIGKRFLGGLLPIFFFIAYLVFNKALWSFFDLCFLGLFDFSSKNGNIFTPIFFLCTFLFFCSCFLVYKEEKNISKWYLLFSVSFVIPLFDIAHFALYLPCFVMLLVPFISLNAKYVRNLSLLLTGITCFLYYLVFLPYSTVLMNHTNHFALIRRVKSDYSQDFKVNQSIERYSEPLLLSYYTMQYHISRGYKLDYFDVLLYGNFGYEGYHKMIRKIEKMHNKIIIIDRLAYEKVTSDTQFAREIVDYVIQNCEKIESQYNLEIYYKK